MKVFIRTVGFAAVTLVLLLSAMFASVYAALSYSRAKAEYSLTALYADSVAEYYSADTQATQIMSRLKMSSDIDRELSTLRRQGISITRTTGSSGETLIRYSVKSGSSSGIEVQLELDNNQWRILSWVLGNSADASQT